MTQAPQRLSANLPIFNELFSVVGPAIKKLVEMELKKIAELPQEATQVEIHTRFYARFNKLYDEGARAKPHLATLNGDYGALSRVVMEVKHDLETAANVLSDPRQLKKALTAKKNGFSDAAKTLIQNELGQDLVMAKTNAKIEAVRKIFVPMGLQPISRSRSVSAFSSSSSHEASNGKSANSTTDQSGAVVHTNGKTQNGSSHCNPDFESIQKVTTSNEVSTEKEVSAANDTNTKASDNSASSDASTSNQAAVQTNGRRSYTAQQLEEMADVVGGYAIAAHVLSGDRYYGNPEDRHFEGSDSLFGGSFIGGSL